MREISKATVRETLQSAWKFLKFLSMESIGNSTYVFTFDNEQDMQKIQDLSPWNIRGHPFVLKHWDRSMAMNELDFSECVFWIQVHDLPLELMTHQNAEILRNQLGTFICTEFDGSSVSQRKNFLRIKVLLPLNNPLIIGFNQARSNRHPSWVHLKYERLSEFCFNCGRLGHSKIYCPATEPLPSPPLFGPSLRAAPLAPFKPEKILASGKVDQSASKFSPSSLNPPYNSVPDEALANQASSSNPPP
jgi:hypothetical protein